MRPILIFENSCNFKSFNSLSDLRKEFDTPPYSQQIEMGRQAEIRCHPPKGSPEARVSHWLKNGDRIEDANFIQSTGGSLLILQARMSDMANYTCVATNDAIERQSQPALITVFGKNLTFLLRTFLLGTFLFKYNTVQLRSKKQGRYSQK